MNITSGASRRGVRGMLSREKGSCKGNSGRKGTYWVIVTKTEAEAVGLVEVEWVGVEYFDVHVPFFEVGGRD